MTNFVKTFLTDESGATAIEYGLIAALVSVAAIGTLTTLGTSLDTIFGVANTSLKKAADAAKTP
ncbi:Flp family type IVb pilin [Kiloniella majae]|uniref:Flp family type IVb pilin n=1 Tax=Kiloniella majae TaxID=1938558 RepID=UPI000A278D3D|nr:Flp family type IVb pilin [Kiloniella majae]